MMSAAIAEVVTTMVTLNVHEPLAGIVKPVVVAELPTPGVASGVTPTQVELALGTAALTRPGA